jgi:hypothetical protein
VPAPAYDLWEDVDDEEQEGGFYEEGPEGGWEPEPEHGEGEGGGGQAAPPQHVHLHPLPRPPAASAAASQKTLPALALAPAAAAEEDDEGGGGPAGNLSFASQEGEAGLEDEYYRGEAGSEDRDDDEVRARAWVPGRAPLPLAPSCSLP